VKLGDRYFWLLLSLHSTLLVTSTIAGAKVFALPFGLSASATVFSYILTFIIIDAIAEVYGREYSRFVINVGLLGMFVSAIYLRFAIALPPAASYERHQAAFEDTLGSTWRIWLGGWVAYILSQHLDVWVFLKLRRSKEGNALVFRTWASNLLAQLLDTIVFITIAFNGSEPIGPLIAGQYLVKIAFATFASPLVSLAVLPARLSWLGAKEKSPQRHD
jgi:uncharacterized integral membrane protein (TIGR00697 family)